LSLWKQGFGAAFVEEDELANELETALRLEPNFIDAHLLSLMKAARDYWFSMAGRAESETKITQHLAALEQLDTAPVKLATARAVRRYYLEHDPRGGVEILAPFRRTLVRNTESAMFYAYMLRRIGQIDEAFDILHQVVDQDPSAISPVETQAELLAFLGQGGAAMAVLQESIERFGDRSHARIKMASFGYQLTGDTRFLVMGRNALTDDPMLSKLRHHADMELARREGDLQKVRELARSYIGEDKTVSGHGLTPKELVGALALRAGGAPEPEVRSLATEALEKLQRWRQESDSDARRGTMAVALALLGRAEEAKELSAEVEAAFPLERDELEAADRIQEAASIFALLGNDEEVVRRLQILRQSRFYALSLCGVPFDFATQAIWDLPAAREFINTECAPLWERNRKELQPVLAQAAIPSRK